MGSHRGTMRPRRQVSPATLSLLRPLFRHSVPRDAWILRRVGNHLGPVLVRKGTDSDVQDMQDRAEA